MKKFICAIALVLGFSVFGAAPAYAHEVEVFQGQDRGWVGSAHNQAGVQDKECDGNPVYIIINQFDGYWKIYDENGCDPGGSSLPLISNSGTIRVCEEDGAGAHCSSAKPL